MLKDKCVPNTTNILVIALFVMLIVANIYSSVYIVIGCFLFGTMLIEYDLKNKIPNNSRHLFLLLIFFWFQEFSSAQDNRLLRTGLYVAEVLLIIRLLLSTITNNRIETKNQRSVIVFVLCGFVVSNFIACLATYGSITIFLYSTYDSCKYFVLMLYILALAPTQKEIECLLDLFFVIVIIITIISLLQFSGVQVFYDAFRGRYNIINRFGSLRAIGIFPFGIELGNYSCVVFALYHNYPRFNNKMKSTYVVAQICAVLCAVLSGTRTSIVIIIVALILSDISNVKSWAKTVLLLLVGVLLFSNYMDMESLISRTKNDVLADLPRVYYFVNGINVWKDHMFFGIGYNTYGSMKYRSRTNDFIFNEYGISKYSDYNLATTDSFVSELIPEFGVIGLFLICIFVAYLIRYYKRNEVQKRMFFITILSICMMALNTSTPFISPHIGTFFWISCGLMFCLDEKSEGTDV